MPVEQCSVNHRINSFNLNSHLHNKRNSQPEPASSSASHSKDATCSQEKEDEPATKKRKTYKFQTTWLKEFGEWLEWDPEKQLMNLLHLAEIMLVIPISSAQCERGFSAQKRIKSDVRSSLHVSTTEDLIRISMEGPELEKFDPAPPVVKWFNCGQRSRRPISYREWPAELISVTECLD